MSRARTARRGIALLIVAANAEVLVWLWLHDGGISSVHSTADLLTTAGRLTGLLGAYLLLLQVLLLARLRSLERLVGYDRLTVWHRVNGKACLTLILAHVALVTAGYTLLDRATLTQEISTLLTQYAGILDSAIGTGLLILVVVTSLVFARRRLRYEAWYFVHLSAYAAVVLAWFHQIPTGLDFLLNPGAARYWTALYLITLGLVLLFRLALPIFYAFFYQLKVAEVVEERPNVVSLRLTGRHLGHMRAHAGQFFLWRFLTPRLVWESHPFSLSAPPDGQSLRITVKALGDFTARMAAMRPGTRVLGVGPFGLFTAAQRRRERAALIAGGVGITPIRALLEGMTGDIVLVYRVVSDDEIVFRDEIEQVARSRGLIVHYVTGSHRAPGGEWLLSAEHLKEMIPDIAQRELYICGPPAMADLVQTSARQAGVPGKYIHTEAFAFSPNTTRWRGLAYLPARTRWTLAGAGVAAVLALATRLAWVSSHATAAPRPATPTPPPTAPAVVQPTAAPGSTSAPAQYAGGTVTSQHGSVQVTLTTSAGKITAVDVYASPAEPRSQSIEGQAIPILKSETLQAQSAQVDVVSGATETSDDYIQSLQAAVTAARQHKALP